MVALTGILLFASCLKGELSLYEEEIHQKRPDIAAELTDLVMVAELKKDVKNQPTMKEAPLFVTKIKGVKQWLAQSKGTPIKFVCPVYLSTKGFAPSVEA
ncbi:hypothetical protein PN36_29775 [Candidatus Thiomargarita nelsonii]|uniref:Uncharacterized protein n=1 Tax=Candidatus Thiomargarita nelsonii TaxID=1003181 RepID=A0A0A6PBV1_9GAMM|nr:hypothetical protein PN36_29775 [Candidatus Thiomargarita nelsonii]